LTAILGRTAHVPRALHFNDLLKAVPQANQRG
jgi:hypothetical protein